jgi:hypothetical protein
MPVKTLVDKLTNESNTWLNACRLEDVGNYAEAIILYLNDAIESIRIGSLVRAGLSCSCAADCLLKFETDGLPKKLYFRAATIYVEIAKSSVHKSIQEWLWSLQKAYENFVLAEETSMAKSVLDQYMVLANKIQPYVIETKSSVLKSSVKTLVAAPPLLDLPEKVVDAVNLFLEQQAFPL